jgi:hypothetical protein
MGFLAPFHHPVSEYLSINKSAYMMPYFVVHLGNPEKAQICVKNGRSTETAARGAEAR